MQLFQSVVNCFFWWSWIIMDRSVWICKFKIRFIRIVIVTILPPSFFVILRNPMKNQRLLNVEIKLNHLCSNCTISNTVCKNLPKVFVRQGINTEQRMHTGVPPWEGGPDVDLCYLHAAFPSSLKRRQLESNLTRCVVRITLQSITKLIIFPLKIFVSDILLFTCGKSKFLLKLINKRLWILP